MDVRILSYIFLVCVTCSLVQTTEPETPREVSVDINDGNQCTAKYTTCSLTVDGKPLALTGKKGEPGLSGPPGNPGPRGNPGENGAPGLQGLDGLIGAPGEKGEMGLPGASGEKGEPGKNGEPGIPGDRGPKGDLGERGWMGLTGPSGAPGMPGKKGEMGPEGPRGLTGPKGKEGIPGPTGPPGSPGLPGICPCSLPVNADLAGSSDSTDDFGAEDNPSEFPCKSEQAKGIKSGIYWMGPTDHSMKVYCNMTTKETCIRTSKATPVYNYKLNKGTFWLNAVSAVNMNELYNDISLEQLNWFRSSAISVRQTLKYHCFDSVPYPKHNVSSSVKLWAWNDVVIGPFPTTESPIFYSVPEATDNCKEGSKEWKSTLIELQSLNVNRLPIVDIWIGDIRSDDQKMSIESVELCFG